MNDTRSSGSTALRTRSAEMNSETSSALWRAEHSGAQADGGWPHLRARLAGIASADVRGDHVQPVSHTELGGAMSRANDSAYSLKTSVSGMEGLINHVVSIPVIKATICAALTVTSISMRYRPAR